MYQDVLDSLNKKQTLLKHMNDLKSHIGKSSDVLLQKYISSLGTVLRQMQKTIDRQKNKEAARQDRAVKFIILDEFHPASKALIDYCHHMLQNKNVQNP